MGIKNSYLIAKSNVLSIFKKVNLLTEKSRIFADSMFVLKDFELNSLCQLNNMKSRYTTPYHRSLINLKSCHKNTHSFVL